MKVLRGSSGLGDAIYLRPVADILKKTVSGLRVTTPYADVFKNTGIPIIPFRKDKADLCVSAGGRRKEATTQFQDICILAGLPQTTELKIEWGIINKTLTESVTHKAKGKPIMLVKSSYMTFGRPDDYGKEMMPNYQVMDSFLEGACKNYFKILVGSKNAQSYRFKNIDLDMWGQTNITDLFDLALISECAIAQVGFMAPLMESLDKKLVLFFSDKGLKSKEELIRYIMPHKIVNKKTTLAVIDTDPLESIIEKFNGGFNG